MTDDELKAIDKRLADMSARVDRVIAKEKLRGKLMPTLKARLRPRGLDEEVLRFSAMMFNHGMALAPKGGSIEDIFAEFERQFDEMAQAHRQRA